MVQSARRIFSALLLVSVALLAFSFITAGSSQCPSIYVCLANISLFNPSLSVSISTPDRAPVAGMGIDFSILNEVLRVVSIYALLIAVIVLIVLEAIELHYLKLLFRH